MLLLLSFFNLLLSFVEEEFSLILADEELLFSSESSSFLLGNICSIDEISLSELFSCRKLFLKWIVLCLYCSCIVDSSSHSGFSQPI